MGLHRPPCAPACSIELGKEHTEFAEAKIQQRIIERQLSDEEIDTLALVAVAGMAAEGREYEEVRARAGVETPYTTYVYLWAV